MKQRRGENRERRREKESELLGLVGGEEEGKAGGGGNEVKLDESLVFNYARPEASRCRQRDARNS